ncbi:hypothetical protein 2 [Beihai sobemo-like virus 12]|uniref:hypothetical protein 2 n=1 Tax=Beihai sobemo-like virus 12 TaxID=1922683 RepID=UPI00090B78AF|nr:hypothetical protein 2 [Beihai sobemo-like virus 12]APG75735.1 hypothetical protein 2 [Beihai sobemo-like virus 12]
MLEDVTTFTSWINNINRETMRMDPDSSPGLPWGGTNGDRFGYVPCAGYDPNKLDELRMAVLIRIEELKVAPALDPIFVFIKQEMHKKSKAVEGRWRLICGVGLTDQIVARILFEPYFDFLLDHPLIYKTAIGWGLTSHGSLSYMNFFLGGGQLQAADKSAWDWTVQPWVFEVFKEIMHKMHIGREDLWHQLMEHHIDAICYHKVLDIVGRKLDCPPGIMPSGWFMTIAFNSVAQLILHAYADDNNEFDWPFVMGDDTIQKPASDRYWKRMTTTGAKIKDIVTTREFVGFVFKDRSYHPSYTVKYNCKMNNIPPEVLVETLTSYQWLYAFEPEKLKIIHRYMCEIGASSHIVTSSEMADRVLGLKSLPVGSSW